MLKKLAENLRSKPPEPTVWHGRTRDVWPDPNARDHCWYCGWCGHNQAGYATPADAERAAHGHKRTRGHDGVAVAEWE